MKEFVMILSMWGQNVTGTWEYIGNQYVYNTPMTQEVCEKKISRKNWSVHQDNGYYSCLLYTSPSPRDRQKSRMPSSA